MKAIKAIRSFFRSKYLEGKTMKLQMLVLSVLLVTACTTVGAKGERMEHIQSLNLKSAQGSILFPSLDILQKNFLEEDSIGEKSLLLKIFLETTSILNKFADKEMRIFQAMEIIGCTCERYFRTSNYSNDDANEIVFRLCRALLTGYPYFVFDDFGKAGLYRIDKELMRRTFNPIGFRQK